MGWPIRLQSMTKPVKVKYEKERAELRKLAQSESLSVRETARKALAILDKHFPITNKSYETK